MIGKMNRGRNNAEQCFYHLTRGQRLYETRQFPVARVNFSGKSWRDIVRPDGVGIRGTTGEERMKFLVDRWLIGEVALIAKACIRYLNRFGLLALSATDKHGLRNGDRTVKFPLPLTDRHCIRPPNITGRMFE